MDCEKVKQLLPGYLDGAVMTGTWCDTHVSIGRHLERCDDCRDELRAYQAMSSMMSSVQRPMPPADLALRIRVAAAQRLSDRDWLHYVRRAETRAEMVLKNILEPLAIPATGGFAVAFVVFVLVCQLLGSACRCARDPMILLQICCSLPAWRPWLRSRSPALRSPGMPDLTRCLWKPQSTRRVRR